SPIVFLAPEGDFSKLSVRYDPGQIKIANADGAEAKIDSAALAKQNTDHILYRLANDKTGMETGEGIAWHWAYSLGRILEACKVWPNDDWMAPTEKALNILADKMVTGPDGYKGFVGPYIYDANKWADVHIGDAILIKPMLSFAEVVFDNPALREKYGASADKFVALAKRELIEKWEKRGTFVVDGPFAGYHEWNMFCKPGDFENWYVDENHSQSIPYNKDMQVAVCMLQIHRITGEEQYRAKAEKIFNRFKAGISRFDGAATWNYWEPTYPRDIASLKNENHRMLRHWVDTHPNAGYQASEINDVAYAYNMGVTFTEDDMRRFIATQLRFMWNGDKANPKLLTSVCTIPRANPPEEHGPGAVWSGLAGFDATIRELTLQAFKDKEKLLYAGIANLPEPSLKRKFRPDAKVEDFPWMKGIRECAGGQTFAVAIPSVMEAGKGTVFFSKSHAPRTVAKIYVRPAAGGERKLITEFPSRGFGGSEFFAHEWDGTIDGKRLKGDFVIIWDYMDGERAYPVTIK
ncbi:MAG: hypothetical protein FWG05_03045, partial [Kiritimatiellaeota bacterium]|nr:hypothetical protein [Kiritimatiellota bacterium]